MTNEGFFFSVITFLAILVPILAHLFARKRKRSRHLVSGPCKMVLLVRTDLGMSEGKVVAQCCHAAVDAVQKSGRRNKHAVRHWSKTGATKIALGVDSLEDLKKLVSAAEKASLTTSLVHDAGRTQVEPGTVTVGAIGPDQSTLIDKITRHLALLK
ncbi:MAG: peptidyl-tRNA hydrolase [Amphiamblys sp. WSBS2006]|nr:MAG: peptidyl-tRNA hydrolase [Amphiamblys sp. WSBS2006]